MPIRSLRPTIARHDAERCSTTRRAFTLPELVLSMAVMVVLLGGITSAIVIATHAVPDAQDPAAATAGAAEALEEIAAELFTATDVRVRSPTRIEFAVADRDGDAIDEIIEYRWSGTPGDALTRKYNAGNHVDVVEDVRELAFAFDVTTNAPQGPGVATESAEMVLMEYQGGSGGVVPLKLTVLVEEDINANNWVGTCFSPTLPAEATAWSITRATFLARKLGAWGGEMLVQIRSDDGSLLPTGSVLDQVSVMEDTLGVTMSWQSVSLNTGAMTADSGACLAFEHVAGGSSSALQAVSGALLPSGATFVRTTDSGATWTADGSLELLFQVHGTITTVGPPPPAPDTLHTINIVLRAGPDPAARVETAIETLNHPEVDPI